MTKNLLIVYLTALLGGLFLGEAAWRAALGTASEQLPSGWNREPLQIPYKLAAHLGDLPLNEGDLALDYYRGIYPQGAVSSLAFDVHLPEDGQLELWMSSPHNILPQMCEENPRAVECRVKSYPASGIVIENIETPSTQTIRGKDHAKLSCKGELPPPIEGKNRISIMLIRGGVTFGLNGTEITCMGSFTQLPPLIRPGIRELHISNIRQDGAALRPILPPNRYLLWITGALSMLMVCWLELKREVRVSLVMLTTLPLLFTPLFILFDWRSWIEAMRAAWLPWRWMSFFLPLFLMVGLKILHLGGSYLNDKNAYRAELDHPGTTQQIVMSLSALLLLTFPPLSSSGETGAAVGILLLTLLGLPLLLKAQGALLVPRARFFMSSLTGSALLFAIVVDTLHVWAALWAALSALLLGILIWANAQARYFRYYNPLCLVAALMLFVSGEGFIRGTKAGRQWSNQGARTEKNDMFGWIAKANQGFELLEKGEHRAYPDEGYPTFFSEEKKATTRIVALGGSTTGGAYQNDDLSEFYPAKMQKKLSGSWEIINQGVGGWTTWHIQHYLDEKAKQLKPDIMTLYIGHNDLLTSVPLPYKQLYRAWQSGGASRGIGEALGDFRLYHLLRHLIVSIRPATKRAAVPVSDARENLEKITALAKEQNAKVLLASEGLAPDPGPMKKYNEMLSKIAATNDHVRYLDVADKLHHYPSPKVYLDDCHLTQYGHDLVAGWMAEEVSLWNEAPSLQPE